MKVQVRLGLEGPDGGPPPELGRAHLGQESPHVIGICSGDGDLSPVLGQRDPGPDSLGKDPPPGGTCPVAQGEIAHSAFDLHEPLGNQAGESGRWTPRRHHQSASIT